MRKHMIYGLGLTVLIFGVGFHSIVVAGEKNVVVFVKEKMKITEKGLPPWSLRNFGIDVRLFNKSNLREGFINALDSAGMLIFEHGAGDDAQVLFKQAKYCRAVSIFLKKGGVVFFQYNGGPNWWGPTKSYLSGIGVAVPGKPQGEYFNLKITKDLEFPVLLQPHDLHKFGEWKGEPAYAYYSNVSDKHKILIHQSGQPLHAVLLMQDKVLGKGTVFFCRIHNLCRPERMNDVFSRELVENILTYAFGKLEHGTAVRLPTGKSNASERRKIFAPGLACKPKSTFNQLYFRNLVKKYWWNQGWKFRIPVVVCEPLGRDQQARIISIVQTFPEDIKLSSMRVVTPWGTEIPSQCRILNKTNNKIEIIFQSDLQSHAYKSFFIYFDNNEKPLPKYKTDLRLEIDDRYCTLSNVRIRTTFRRSAPVMTELQPQANSTGNQLFDDAGDSPEGFGIRLRLWDASKQGKTGFSPLTVLEDGPIRKVISYHGQYQGRPLTIIFSLDTKSRRIDYAYSTVGNEYSLARWIGFLPGKGYDPDVPDGLYFSGTDRLKKIDIMQSGEISRNLLTDMGEYWYAFEDTETGQAIGEIFEGEKTKSIWMYIHQCLGYMPTIYTLIGDKPTKGAFVSLPDGSGFGGIRKEYQAFKNPPMTWLAGVQEQGDLPEKPVKPVFGKNLIRAYYRDFVWYFGRRAYPAAPHLSIPFWIESTKSRGANWLKMWAYQPLWKSRFNSGPQTEFLEHLIPLCKEAGMGLEIGVPYLRRPKYWGSKCPKDWKHSDYIKYENLILEAIAELAEHEADIYTLMDEECFVIKSEEARQRFRQKYGMEPVKVDYHKLKEPACHNTALFQMNAYTEICRKMAGIIRRKHPAAYVTDQVNISSMTAIGRGAPHDFERHSDFFNTMTMDLYGKPTESYKYYIKLIRSMLDNVGPIALFCCCDPRKQYVIPNQDYLLMWGIDGLYQYEPGEIHKKIGEIAANHFHYLDYTGLGDMLASYAPLRRVAIFRDRDGVIDSIKRGLWSTRGSGYDVRVQNIIFTKNLQADIVMSKYLNVSNLKTYPLLMVPNDPVLSNHHARTMEKYMKSGGIILLEGEGLKNELFQSLAGIRITGATSHYKGKVDGKFIFSGNRVQVANKSAEVLFALADGSPALLGKSVGKGRLIYTPLLLSEKIVFQDDLQAFLKEIIDRFVPDHVLDIIQNGHGNVDSNILTDGKDYILALYNFSCQDEEVKLKWRASVKPQVVCNFRDGRIVDFSGVVHAVIPKENAVFLYFGRRMTIAPVATEQLPQSSTFGYSAYPGRDLAVWKPLPMINTSTASVRVKKPGLRYIAILTDKGRESKRRNCRVTGDEGIYAALQSQEGLKVEYIWDTKAETLAFYDAVIIPNIGWSGVPPVLAKGWEKRIHQYVVNGGSAMLCHHAVGISPARHPPFPEIAAPPAEYVVQIKEVKIVRDHPLVNARSIQRRFPKKAEDPAFDAQLVATAFQVGDTYTFGFIDYVPLKPAPGSTVIVRGCEQNGRGGEAVIVAGKSGKGKVVLSGIALGEKDIHIEGAVKGDKNIIINAAYWLTDK